MEDPTTLGLNLTFFGTLGLALIMFIGLGILVAITLVLAGVAKLISVILLAMVGVYPKRDTVPVVHLPPRPRRVPALQAEHEESTTAHTGSADAAPLVPGNVPALVPGKPRLGPFATAKLVFSAGWNSIRSVPWKTLLDPRAWPKPAKIKAGLASTATAVATSQAKEHPLVVAVKPEPPVLNSKWAAAVAEADARAAARAEEAAAEEPPPAPTKDTRMPLDGTPREFGERPVDPHAGKQVSPGRQAAGVGARPRA